MESMVVQARGLVYTPEVVEALSVYMGHLRDARGRLKERRREAENQLRRYGVGREDDEGAKEKVMKEIARVYGEMVREVEDIKRDMSRLKRGA